MALPTTTKIGAGTAVPTTAAAVPNVAFKALGYVSEDGLEPQGERTVNAIRDWNADIIAQLQTEHSVRFSLTLYAAWDSDVLTQVFGADNVTVTAATASTGTLITVEETGSVLPHRAWIFDMAHDLRKLRIVLPNAKITEVTERPYVAGELAGFQITVEAFKDSSGVKAYRYYDDGVFSA
jgi:hypothetical protein